MHILNDIRALVRRNTVLYRIWFYLVRSKKGDRVRLPLKTDDFYFDGFPRSGNTYMASMISHFYRDLKFTSHLHTIAGLKLASHQRLKIIITIRKPLEVVSSLLFTKLEGQITESIDNDVDRELAEYIAYYKFVDTFGTEHMVLHFPHCIQDKSHFIESVESFVQSEKILIEDAAFDKFEEKMQQAEEIKAVQNGSFPNEIREKFKINIRPLIQSAKEYQLATEIYNQISDAR